MLAVWRTSNGMKARGAGELGGLCCHVGHASHMQLGPPKKTHCAELGSCGWLMGKMYLLKVPGN